MSRAGVSDPTWDKRPVSLQDYHRLRLEHLRLKGKFNELRVDLYHVLGEIDQAQRDDTIWGKVAGIERIRHHVNDMLEQYHGEDMT